MDRYIYNIVWDGQQLQNTMTLDLNYQQESDVIITMSNTKCNITINNIDVDSYNELLPQILMDVNINIEQCKNKELYKHLYINDIISVIDKQIHNGEIL